MIVQLKTKTDRCGNTYYLTIDHELKNFSWFSGYSDITLKVTKKEINETIKALLESGYTEK